MDGCSYCLCSMMRRRILAVAVLAVMALKTFAAGHLTFSCLMADLGKMYDTDSLKTVSFSFVNDGDAPIVIKQVRTSCGCTVADIPAGSVSPQEQGTLSLCYNPHNQIGTVDVKAYVYTADDEKSPAAVLRLTGVVSEPSPYSHYKVQMGPLRLRRNTITRIVSGPQVERIACGNTSDKEIKLTCMLLPKGVSVRTEPEVIPPRGEADIVITIDSSLSVTKELPIILDGVHCSPSERTIVIMP